MVAKGPLLLSPRGAERPLQGGYFHTHLWGVLVGYYCCKTPCTLTCWMGCSMPASKVRKATVCCMAGLAHVTDATDACPMTNMTKQAPFYQYLYRRAGLPMCTWWGRAAIMTGPKSATPWSLSVRYGDCFCFSVSLHCWAARVGQRVQGPPVPPSLHSLPALCH